MFYQKLFTALLLFVAVTTQAQQKFTYTPEKPKPGDVLLSLMSLQVILPIL
jgi:hypothetical protein